MAAHPLSRLAACLALALGSPLATPQEARHDAPAEIDLGAAPDRVVAPLPERPAPSFPASDEEELELGDGEESALEERRPSGPARCDASLPSGATVGLWPAHIGAAPSCATRMWARAQYPLAEAVHLALWCSDPAGAKARSRQAATTQAATQKSFADARGPASTLDLFKFSTLLTARAKPPALDWDFREANVCKGGAPRVPAELGPNLSAYAAGFIATPSGTCEAFVVESTMATGRSAGSRVSWISSSCPGFFAPDPSAIAAALAGGQAAAQAWQDAHLSSWRWRGPAPRPAMGRSAGHG